MHGWTQLFLGSSRDEREAHRAKCVVPAPALAVAISESTVVRATWCFVALGLFVRVVRYLLGFPLWGDECALAVNLLDRTYADLLRPLDFQQVAPPLFLWIELAVVKLFGFSEWSLRGFPFACSLLSVLLFRHIAVRLAPGVPGLIAVAVFAVSYYPLRHASEVKPYASDLAVALGMVACAVEWWRRPDRPSWLWLLTVVAAAGLGLSHPSVFVCGAIGIALAFAAWQRGHHTAWPALAAYGGVVALVFAGLYVLSIRAQFDATRTEGVMEAYWSRAFPPLTRPLAFLAWCVTVHTGQLFAYPTGGADAGAGALMFVCFAAGLVWMCRHRVYFVLVLVVAPFVLTFIAAALHRYPYGGFARTAQHLAPMICLSGGLGAAWLLTWLRRERLQRSALRAVMIILCVLGVGMVARDLVRPYRTDHDLQVREFARWFWKQKAIDAELACVRTDLKQPFFHETYLWRGIAQYLCNQRIYGAARNTGGPDWDAVSPSRPLRCVVFSRPGLSRDEAAFRDWLADMQARFDWTGYERHEFHKPHRHGPDIERIELYEFVPRGTSADSTGVVQHTPGALPAVDSSAGRAVIPAAAVQAASRR